jgi:hypothetical protein
MLCRSLRNVLVGRWILAGLLCMALVVGAAMRSIPPANGPARSVFAPHFESGPGNPRSTGEAGWPTPHRKPDRTGTRRGPNGFASPSSGSGQFIAAPASCHRQPHIHDQD